MTKKTKFEQVPLEVVKKIVEEQVEREDKTGLGRGIKEKELEQLEPLLLPERANGKCRKI